MTGTEFLLLGLVVIAAVVAGYFIGRWSSDRELGARSARPNPLPAPDDLPQADGPVSAPAQRQRGAPPPASAGGDGYDTPAAPAPRQRSAAPPPAAAGGEPASGGAADAEPRRAKRGPPPPAAAGLMDTGDGPKRSR